MSVLIGTICKGNDGIILAADSQIMSPHDGTHASVDKLSVVNFQLGQILIGHAGLWSATNRVVEHLKQKAVHVKMIKPLDVLSIVEDSVRQTKQPLDEKQLEFLSSNGASLLLAFYIGDEPYLYTIDVCSDSNGIATPCNRATSQTAGIGGSLADYLLHEFSEPNMDAGSAIAVLAFVINKVKQTTVYCGGQTRIKRLVAIPCQPCETGYVAKMWPIEDALINSIESRLEALNKKNNAAYAKKAREIILKEGTKRWEKYLRTLK